jgi:hypothetical protein
MKSTIITTLFTLITIINSAQSFDGFSYQALLRDANNASVANENVSMRISIIPNSQNDASIYTEEHTASTNENGLLSITIGKGNSIEGSFNTIDWGAGKLFLKTEIDIEGGSNYNHYGTTELLSVPFALHSKTAETAKHLEGDINESDPIFEDSPAYNISFEEIDKWNNITSSDEVDPLFTSSVAGSISSFDTLMWNNKLSFENDPVFTGSTAYGISQYDTAKWNQALLYETDPTYSSSVASLITSADIVNWNNKLGAESVAAAITAQDTINWNNKLDTEVDGSISNELQVLSKTGLEFTLSNGGGTVKDSIVTYTAGDGIEIIGTEISEKKFEVGDIYMGGVIFYIDQSGEHGLIVHPRNSPQNQFSYGGYKVQSKNTHGLYGGELSSHLILSFSIQNGYVPSNTAAFTAMSAYTNATGGLNVNGWYLPTVHELKQLSIVKDIVNTTLTIMNSDTISNDAYWSSTENNINDAYKVRMNDGGILSTPKTQMGLIRAVRSF